MAFDTQPILENDSVKIVPLKADDFEKLYQLAADPLIWLQHPDKNRYKKSEFTKFFEKALETGSAFKIVDKATHDFIGSTRFYDYNEKERSVSIGYTFYAVACWGKGINPEVKQLMIEYAFQFVDKIYFHVGVRNFRSQKAMEKLGAELIDQKNIQYTGELAHEGLIYQITKQGWTDFLKAKEEEENKSKQE